MIFGHTFCTYMVYVFSCVQLVQIIQFWISEVLIVEGALYAHVNICPEVLPILLQALYTENELSPIVWLDSL